MVMKHGVIVFLSILVLALSPCVAPAQGFLEGGFPAMPALPGLPAFGNLFGGGGGSCDSCEDPSPFGLFGTVGWNYETIDLSFRTLSAGLWDIDALKHTYKFSGLELGLAAKAVSRTGFGAIGRFTILVTGSTRDTENYDYNIAPWAGSRHWRAKNDTYCFDGMGFYNVYNSAALVGGFRWNHLETSFDRPDGEINIAGLAGDEAVLITNVFQPYVGAMIDQGGASYVLRLGIIGWPQLYGSAKYEQTVGASFFGVGDRINGMTAKVNEGYFWEAFAEYGLKNEMLMGAAVSVFGSWTQYHLKGTFNVDDDVIGLGTIDDDYWNISMHRNSWTAGVKVAIPLALPVPFYF
jgi:hypothetical protein